MPRLLSLVIAVALVAAPRTSEALPKVLLCYADPTPNAATIMATGINPNNANFAAVDAVDCQRNTPSLQQLKMYEAVLLWNGSLWSDRNALGNNLYDYVNAGGGVVIGMLGFFNAGGQGFDLGGNWASNKYNCVSSGNLGQGILAAQPKDPQSPLVAGVTTLTANNIGTGGLAQGATSVWDWNGGQPAIATCKPGGHLRVDLNFYMASGTWKGDGFQMIKNALIHVAGGLNPLRASPSPVAFPNTGTGAVSAPITVTFTNTSMLAATANSLAVTGANGAEFSIVKQPQFPVTVQPNMSFSVDVAFIPASMGARVGTLLVDVAAQQGMAAPPPAQVQMSGSGIGAKLTVTPNPVSSGGTKIGVKVTRSVTIANGGGGKIQISAISVGGPVFVLSGVPDLPLVIGSGGSFPINLEFTPVQNGISSDTISITTNDPNAPTIKVPVTGFAGPQAISTDAGTIAFGSINVGAKSLPNTLNITNAGFSDLKLTGALTLTGNHVGDFVLDAKGLGGGSVIPAQSMVPISVTFGPTQMGVRDASLLILSDDPMTPTKTVRLLGTGTTATLSVAPMVPIDFGQVRVAATSKSQDITIGAKGSGSLRVMSVSFTGPNASAFTQVGGQVAPFSVAPNGMTAVSVACKPDGIGGLAGTATIVTDVGMAAVQLKCAGTSPRLVVTPNFIDFGAVAVNQSASKVRVELLNSGTDTLEFRDLSIDGPDSQDFPSANLPLMFPVTLAPMMKLSFDVGFTPTMATMETAQINFFTDDPLLPQGYINLVGSGAQSGLTVTPQPLDFGSILYGTSAGPLPVTITNNGDLPLRITSVTVGAAGVQSFRVMPTIDMGNPVTLAPRQSIGVEVTYMPNNVGNASAPLIVTAVGIQPLTITLKGSSFIPMLLFGLSGGGSTLDFGDVGVGVTSGPKDVAIRNAGTMPVTIEKILSDSPLFTVDSSTAKRMLAPKEETIVTVTFKPTRIEMVAAKLNVQLAGINTAAASLKLSGNGIAVGPVMNMNESSCSVGRRSSNQGGIVLALIVLLLVTGARSVRKKEVR